MEEEDREPEAGTDARPPAPPALGGVLETVLYFPEGSRGEVEGFYRDVLGMQPIGRPSDRSIFFRAGGSVFLLFDAARSLELEDPPPHGALGPGHSCLLAGPEGYEAWRRHIQAAGVSIEGESAWPGGGRSFYFRDPAGNLLEIADRDIWPDPDPEA